MPSLKSVPVTTILLTLAALIIAGVPGIRPLLHLDWAAVARGELWRLWSGHLVHWTTDHLLWDVLAFAVLGTLCESESRLRYLLTIAIGLPTISLGLAALCPEVSIYRGLSGLDTGLFVWLVASQLRHSCVGKQRGVTVLWGGLLVGLIGKLIFEASTGSCLFVTTSADSFQPLVESHLLGAAVGLAAFAAGFLGDGQPPWQTLADGHRRLRFSIRCFRSSPSAAAAPCATPWASICHGSKVHLRPSGTGARQAWERVSRKPDRRRRGTGGEFLRVPAGVRIRRSRTLRRI